MVGVGFGWGCGMWIYKVKGQNTVPTKIGQAPSALTFFRQIAATIALAAMGSVLTSAYVPSFHNALTSGTTTFLAQIKQATGTDLLGAFDNPNILLSADAKAQMTHVFQSIPGGMPVYEQLISAVKVGLTQGVHDVFIFSFCFAIVGFILVWFLKEIPLLGGKKKSKPEQIEEEAEEI